MADLTQTITNSVNTFGPAPSSKWGNNAPNDSQWGVFKWGEGTEDLILNVDKLIENATALPDTSILKDSEKLIENATAFPDTDIIKLVDKLIENATAIPDTDIIKLVDKLVENATAFPDTTIYKDAIKVIENSQAIDSTVLDDLLHILSFGSLAPTFEMSEETLAEPSGYNYVFPGPTTDSDEQNLSTYTEGSAASVSYTSQTAGTDGWS